MTRARAWVPCLWRLEVANALNMAVRRKRVDTAFRDVSLADLAQAHQLAVYDAAYLELAQRTALPLATLDRDLCNASQAAGVALLGLQARDFAHRTPECRT